MMAEDVINYGLLNRDPKWLTGMLQRNTFGGIPENGACVLNDSGAKIIAEVLEVQEAIIARQAEELRLLAMLAAGTPQFFNPMRAMAAKQLRDEILKASAPSAADR
jgi:hypothetical protein